MAKSWVEKYAPKKISQIIGQDSCIEKLRENIKNFKAKRKAAIIYGPSGCGKTIAVHALANELNLELIEVNASDTRNKEQIEQIVGNASKQRSLFFSSKIILLDEIDGLSGSQDRGGISAIAGIIENSAFPIVCTANDPFDRKFSDLRKKSELIEFNSPKYTSIAKVLKEICKGENIKYADEDIDTLARRSGGDFRGAINDLQTLVLSTKELKKEIIDELSEREKEESILNALMIIFKTTDPNVAIGAFDYITEDMDECVLWIDENLPQEYEKPQDLARAYDYLSKADIFNSRIRRWQHWRFLVYVNAFLTAGIAVSKDEKYKKFVPYKQTTRILKIWQANMKYVKRKAIAEKISDRLHCSIKDTIKNTMPYLQAIYKNNKSMAEKISIELDLDREEVEWLSR